MKLTKKLAGLRERQRALEELQLPRRLHHVLVRKPQVTRDVRKVHIGMGLHVARVPAKRLFRPRERIKIDLTIYRETPVLGCPHAKCWRNCRPGRPRCRLMRSKNPKWVLCECGAYHHPHRKGAGWCGNNERIWEWMDTPLRDGR